MPSRIFIDANVPTYAVGQEHPLREPCRAVLQKIVQGDISACTDTEVHQEIFYRYWSIKQIEKGVNLSCDFQAIVTDVLPVTANDIQRARELSEEYPYMQPRDWLHLAVMLNNRLTEIISADRHFDEVEHITRLDPIQVWQVGP